MTKNFLGMYCRTLNVLLLLLTSLVVANAEEPGHNFTDPLVPYYSDTSFEPNDYTTDSPLKVVSFNIKFGQRLTKATNQLKDRELLGSDIILLQEMDSEGTEQLARTLAYNYVYYPAVIHTKHGREFGNAILTRLPIVSHHKIILPHRDHNDLQRIAVVAVLAYGTEMIGVYSLHFGTRISEAERGDQLDAIIQDAGDSDLKLHIFGGDLNTTRRAHIRIVRERFRGPGMIEVCRDIDWTFREWRLFRLKLDHIFVRGFYADSCRRVAKNHGASDHHPIVARLSFAGK